MVDTPPLSFKEHNIGPYASKIESSIVDHIYYPIWPIQLKGQSIVKFLSLNKST